MNPNTCNNCGSDYYFIDGKRRCLACGAVKTENGSDKEQKLLASAFALLREARFDKAESAFADVLKKYPKNAEAYWGKLRSRYHISYVLSGSEKAVPRCPTRSGVNLAEDVDYLHAMEYADEEMKVFLGAQEEAIRIFCSQSGTSKNMSYQFTMGAVDPNGAPNENLKNPLYRFIKNADENSKIPTYKFQKNADETFCVAGIKIHHEAKLELPSSYKDKAVTGIGDSAFQDCEYLTGLVIPAGVTGIGWYAFWGCKGLTRIAIPDSVTSIGNSAFYGCTALTDIAFDGTVAQWSAMNRGYGWNAETGNYTVTCLDGTLMKSES